MAAPLQGNAFADVGTVPQNDNAKNKSQMIALVGSSALFLGVFAPLISLPFIGSVNYFQNGKGDGVIILALAVVSAALASRRTFRFLWLTGFGSAAVVLFTFVNFTMKTTEAAADMRNSLAGNPFSGVGEMALASIQMQWGWAVLVLGIALLFIAAQREVPLSLNRSVNRPRATGSSILRLTEAGEYEAQGEDHTAPAGRRTSMLGLADVARPSQ